MDENFEIVQNLLAEPEIDINHCYSTIKTHSYEQTPKYLCQKTILKKVYNWPL